MEEYVTNLKKWAKEYPGQALAAAAVALVAVSKVMQANTERTNAKAWKQEVQRRSMKDAGK
jgi:hypothetical protein